MFWYVTASLAACGACLVGSIGLLALSSFFVYDNEKNIPGSTSECWYHHVTALVPVTVAFAVGAAFSAWVILNKRKRLVFLGLLVWNTLVLGACLYFLTAFYMQLNEPTLTEDELFNALESEIEKKHSETNGTNANFVPLWLEAVQNKSKECCGIKTFRDWETLWPEHESEVPKSCCKEPGKPDKCHTNLNTIPFPRVASEFIKTDTGCTAEVNERLAKNIRDCLLYLIVLSVLFAVAEVAYILQFCFDYKDESSEDGQGDGLDGQGEMQSFAASDADAGSTKEKPKRKWLAFAFMKKKPKKETVDLEAGKDQGDVYDLPGYGSSEASGITASAGTLPEAVEQQPQQQQPIPPVIPELAKEEIPIGSGASSDSDLDLGPAPEPRHKKKKHRRKSKKIKEDDVAFPGQGPSDSSPGSVPTNQVFLIPDGGKDQQAQYQPVSTKSENEQVGQASPSGSQDEVGDRVASNSGSGTGLPAHTSTRDRIMGMFHIQRKDKDKQDKADTK